jgi:hypothetical protein
VKSEELIIMMLAQYFTKDGGVEKRAMSEVPPNDQDLLSLLLSTMSEDAALLAEIAQLNGMPSSCPLQPNILILTPFIVSQLPSISARQPLQRLSLLPLTQLAFTTNPTEHPTTSTTHKLLLGIRSS